MRSGSPCGARGGRGGRRGGEAAASRGAADGAPCFASLSRASIRPAAPPCAAPDRRAASASPSPRPYWRDLAKAIPRLALDVWAPAQNGTATSANAFCESHTSLKNAFSAAFFSSEARAASM